MFYNHHNGDNTSQFRTEKPTSSSDFLSRYLSDNFLIKEGMIVEVYAGGYTAQITYGNGTEQAIWLGDLMGGLSGTSNISIPAPGTHVIALKAHNGVAIILGALPFRGNQEGVFFDAIHGSSVDVTQDVHHTIASSDENHAISYNNDRPFDILPGEVGWINEFGNVLALLRGLVLLKATETSQIQLHTLDRLVRIISGTLEHFADSFKHVAYNNAGQCSQEYELYRDQTAANGTTAPITTTGAAGEDIVKLKPNLAETPNLVIHSGAIAPLLNIYTKGAETKDGCQVCLGDQGEVKIKTTKEIRLEKISEIKYPKKRQQHYVNDKITTTPSVPFAYSDGNRLRQEGDRDLYETKEYDRHFYDPAAFEFETRPATTTGKSVFTQRDDGSVAIEDAAGSSIELDGQGNINITCAGNLYIRPGGNQVSLVGKNIVSRAKSNIEMCCTEGDIKIKAQDDIQLYAKERGILLETDATLAGEFSTAFGIKLKTNGKAPVILDSGQHILQYAVKNIAIHADATIKQDSPILDINNQITKFTATTNWQGQSPLWQIQTSSCQVKYSELKLVGKIFDITGTQHGSIYGGPGGTFVNHDHFKNEMRYAPDPRGGKHVIYIHKTSNPGNLGDLNVVNQSLTTVIQPLVKDELDKEKFSFAEIKCDDKLYETIWQQQRKTIWDFADDTVNSTLPFPGTGFDNYYRYEATNGVTPTGGAFILSSINTYVI